MTFQSLSSFPPLAIAAVTSVLDGKSTVPPTSPWSPARVAATVRTVQAHQRLLAQRCAALATALAATHAQLTDAAASAARVCTGSGGRGEGGVGP